MESMVDDQQQSQPTIPVHFQLLEIWHRHLGVTAGLDDHFFELGGHSLLVAAMMNDVEQATGKYVAITRFLENPTIRHLATCLVAEAADDDEIQLVQRGEEQVPPLFYFHGDVLGGGFYARKIAAELGAEQPVYTVPPIRLTGDVMPSVEDIAVERVRLIRQHRPRGPYVIGGFCIGALTAYEVARRLAAEGEEVRDVFLINPQLAGKVLRSHLRIVQQLARRRGHDMRQAVETFMRGHRKLERLRDVWNSPLREKARFVIRNSRKLVRGHANGAVTAPVPQTAAPALTDRDQWLLSAFEWIATGHVPKRYNGPVVMFLTEDQERATPFLLRKWRKAAPQIEAQYLPGDHLTCLTVFGNMLASKMRVQLAQLRSAVALWCFAPCEFMFAF